MTTALIIFVLMYAGMLIFSKWRVWFALAAACCMVLFGVLPISAVLPNINWNVIMMIAGTMGLVTLFVETGMPSRLADMILNRVPNACWAVIALSAFSGIISAFVDNVATVLMLAPVGLEICRKLKMNPVPVLIAIAVSSNLQGAATLVGDTTSILLGDYAGMTFLDFIWWKGRPGIFWAVELGAAGTIVILYLLFRKNRQPIGKQPLTPVTDYFPGCMMIAMVVLLICASFITFPAGLDDIKNGLICLTVCGPMSAGIHAEGRLISSYSDAPEWTGMRYVAAGENGLVGVTDDGRALSYSFREKRTTELAVEGTALEAAISGTHIVVMNADGRVFAFGLDDEGQCDVSDWRL